MRQLTLLLVVAALACASTAAALPMERIEITAKVVRRTVVALPPLGREGDAESARWIVRDRHGNVIGDMLIDCRWVTAGLRLCVGQLEMPLGMVAVVGASRTRFLGQLAVVGGTGRYIGADGTLLFKATGTGRYTVSINYRKEP